MPGLPGSGNHHTLSTLLAHHSVALEGAHRAPSGPTCNYSLVGCAAAGRLLRWGRCSYSGLLPPAHARSHTASRCLSRPYFTLAVGHEFSSVQPDQGGQTYLPYSLLARVGPSKVPYLPDLRVLLRQADRGGSGGAPAAASNHERLQPLLDVMQPLLDSMWSVDDQPAQQCSIHE